MNIAYPNNLSFNVANSQLLGDVRYSQGLFDQKSGSSQDLLAAMTVRSKEAASLAMQFHQPSHEPTFNYRQGLDFLESLADKYVLTAVDLQQLHQELNTSGGNWRCVKLKVHRRDQPKRILEIPGNEHSIATGMEKILGEWRRSNANFVEPLITVPLLSLKLMALFPFLDGNLRIIVLLTRHLLIQGGHGILCYADIESEVAATTEALYQSLFQSTFAEKASITHWLSYWWSLLLKVYQRFDDEILTADIRPGRGAKTELINKFVSEQQQHFSSADVSKSFPTISSDMIRTALRSLRDQGVIEAQGHGRGAVWRKR